MRCKACNRALSTGELKRKNPNGEFEDMCSECLPMDADCILLISCDQSQFEEE